MAAAFAASACGAVAQASAADPSLPQWPRVASAIAPDAAMESRIKAIVAGMSVAQKVGQMTQPDISAATPDDVRNYYLGGILNGRARPRYRAWRIDFPA